MGFSIQRGMEVTKPLDDRVDWPVVIVITFISVLGAALRVFRLEFRSLWLDEAVLFWISSGNLTEIVKENAIQNSAPLLFPLMTSVMKHLGDSEYVLRAVPCLVGIAAIPLIFVLAKQFVSGRFACFASVLLALAPRQIEYSQQLREYSLTVLLAISLLLAFLLFLKEPRWTRMSAVALLMCLAVSTQYGLAILIVAINTVFLLLSWRFEKVRRSLGLWGVAQIAVAVFIFVVYETSLKSQLTLERGSYYLSHGYWNGSLWNLFQLATLNTRGIFEFAFPGKLFAVLCLYALMTYFVMSSGECKGGPSNKLTFLFCFLLPFIITFVLSLGGLYPYLGGRQTIFLTPMIYVIASVGVSLMYRLKGMKVVAIILAVVIVGLGVRSTGKYLLSEGNENIRPIVRELSGRSADGDTIYVYYGATWAFRYYYRDKVRPWVEGIMSRDNPRDYFRQLEPILNRKERLWLVFSHPYKDEIEQILEYISARKHLRLVREQNGAWLYIAE